MAEKKSKKKLIIILLLVLIILGAGGGGAFFFLNKPTHTEGDAQAAAPKAPAIPVFFELEPFTVNLMSEDPEADHVLYVGITLELENESFRKNLHTYLPEVQTRLIFLLSSKSIEELRSLEGKLKLSDEIKAVLKQPFIPELPENSVKNVSFTTFILR
ncbi:flagellar basal body-associated protein FliL [Thorsellia anophelis]|uniref:Flagellar protein FliL n=1 Tax=Thorsellia anophelis DSM 18579 TaxID=1123402 RepID=A0A1H9ZT88_9GAMM|nr:flagellar basal body-associated protein FliL [Thorsellia anophelis]SES84947.1 flagellar FliL protein [Thorsellia anophelis DSM 18579]